MSILRITVLYLIPYKENWIEDRCHRDLFRQAMALFDKGWKKDPLRLIGVTVSSLGEDSNMQLSILEKADDYEKSSRLDRSIDALREKYGKDILKRAALLKKDED